MMSCTFAFECFVGAGMPQPLFLKKVSPPACYDHEHLYRLSEFLVGCATERYLFVMEIDSSRAE